MLIEILNHTPTWVYALLAALLLLGWSQTKMRAVPVWRTALMPAAMLGLAGYGVISAFGASVQVVGVWLGGVALAPVIAAALLRPTAGLAYDPRTQCMTLPGSWVPMALILLIFCVRYVVNVALAVAPDLRVEPSFLMPVCLVYGVMSGIFLARVIGTLRATRAAPAAVPVAAFK